MYSSGLKKWGTTVLLSRWQGDGYINGTKEKVILGSSLLVTNQMKNMLSILLQQVPTGT